MNRRLGCCVLGGLSAAIGNICAAGTDIFFNPLQESARVSTPNSVFELNQPYVVPPGLSQENLTSLLEAETKANNSMLRVAGVGNSSSMIDMSSFDPSGRFVFLPHETPFSAGVSRYDIRNDRVEILFHGDGGGASGNWANDYGAFDPSTWTTHDTLFLAEEWTAEGRVIEVMNPFAPADQIQIREVESLANVAHEGLRFSADENTLYFIDEWNSGGFYKFVLKNRNSYDVGQTFVLKVDAYEGDPAENYNHESNVANRTGMATWIPLTDKQGNPLTSIDPFRNGPTSDPKTDPDARGGRGAADEVGATPYGRPEDMEVGRLRNGNEVLYVAVTSEHAIYAIEELGGTRARVWIAADRNTPKNVGFPMTSGQLDSPDNLAQDALGNIYIIEDQPNSSNIGGDVWFLRDVDSDGVAESLDHFMSLLADGSEATGMIFNPVKPTQFVLSVMHPDSADGSVYPAGQGFGDALWLYDLKGIVPPPCEREGRYFFGSKSTCSDYRDFTFVKLLEHANRPWWKRLWKLGW